MIFFQARTAINLFDNADLQNDRLATQMAEGRYLQPLTDISGVDTTLVQLWEDGYRGWVKPEAWDWLAVVDESPPMATALSPDEIRDRLGGVIDFIFSAQALPHQYLWGGTVPPSYDCSGLLQSAFASVGVWLPRDAYQQEGFCERVERDFACRGDLVFFGSARATHVGLYLGDGQYIHSSGKEKGHNGIAISSLTGHDRVSQAYAVQLRGWGRITRNLRGGDYCVT
jgi:hypothetical protein